ncbi:MAG: prolipoprotein diacylglyceryl transferase [Polyangiaceae bacterium]|nr:prolipoprotein diacylglyceryl transferase [Polyangiaceae bacterium]
MIPVIHVPAVEVGPVTIHPFGVTAALAVIVGSALADYRARVVGVDREKLRSFTTWILGFGFVGGHVLDKLAYSPERAIAEPLRLFAIWESQGSFGGFVGAIVGALLFRHFRREKILPLADVIMSVFPIAWIFGRTGCAMAHDHPGIRAEPGSLFAVEYGPYDVDAVGRLPFGIELRHGDAPRYDLGTLELLFTIVVAAFVVAAWRRPRPVGFYVVSVPLVYAPVRWLMDFLRAHEGAGSDARYAGLTPAQWCCMLLFTACVAVVVRRFGAHRRTVAC